MTTEFCYTCKYFVVPQLCSTGKCKNEKSLAFELDIDVIASATCNRYEADPNCALWRGKDETNG